MQRTAKQYSGDGDKIIAELATLGPTHNINPLRRTYCANDNDALIEQSHQRSAVFGLNEYTQPERGPICLTDSSLLIEQNRVLYTHAVPVMATLYDQIINSHCLVILADATGLIVNTLGDDDFLEMADRFGLKPGESWSERTKGTNAIGTAIA